MSSDTLKTVRQSAASSEFGGLALAETRESGVNPESEIATVDGLPSQAENLLIAIVTLSGCHAESGSRRTAMLTAMYLRALADLGSPGVSERIRETC